MKNICLLSVEPLPRLIHMADRIIPLNCPACGSEANEGLRERAFGGEMKCRNCKVTSVLVIDNQWHQKKTGEYVCRECGNIARDGDRFCECGRTLIRKCAVCAIEFFVGKKVCPKCGWNHDVDLGSKATQRDIAARLRTFVKNSNFEEATRELDLLLKSAIAAQSTPPETEAILRELLLMKQMGNATPDAQHEPNKYLFFHAVNSILNKLRGIGGICDWWAGREQDRKIKEVKRERLTSEIGAISGEIFSVESKDPSGGAGEFSLLVGVIVGCIIGIGSCVTGIRGGHAQGCGDFLGFTLVSIIIIWIIIYAIITYIANALKSKKLSGLWVKKRQIEERIRQFEQQGSDQGSSDQDLVSSLGMRYGVPTVDLEKWPAIDPSLIALVPAELAHKHRVLPLQRSGNVLTLAMSDPTNIFAMDDVRSHTGYNVDPVVSSAKGLARAIERYYGSPSGVKPREDAGES